MKYLLLTFMVLLNLSAFSQKIDDKKLEKISEKTLHVLIDKEIIPANLNLKIDSVIIDKDSKIFDIYFSKELTYLPIRENWLQRFKASVRSSQKRRIRKKYSINYYSNSEKLSTFIPNIYRVNTDIDTDRLEKRISSNQQNVTNISNVFQLQEGLQNKHIAIWGGHGLYFSTNDSIWKWQRPNLFTTVEDMFTFSYVVPYIMPMLQNAGANVYYPKERDSQSKEYVLDFDTDKKNITLSSRVNNIDGGFKLKNTYSDYENPFKLGTHHQMKSLASTERKDSINYNFTDVEKGKYAVYISYSKSDNNISDAKYTVYHDGGKTTFSINQKMGNSTWIYLGRFQFGENNNSRVVVSNVSEEEGSITSDAIKIGGGFNRIEREGTIATQPAYMNAGRYYLQYAGAPDSTVYTLTKGSNDYKDDYKSRGEWVNYLLGQPYSINRDSSLQGLNIPIDMSLSFHTDAGATKTDSIIGTLVIHSTYDINMKREFPDGRSRFANRDLADIVHTEITDLIKNKYSDKWNRRPMWDKRYSEATYPNVPSLLIELMSHQNFSDMKYGLDPNFKFDVSRSIYIGILKFLAYSNNENYTVSPLAINSFSINYKNKELHLNWKETVDDKEESAKAESYIVYKKVGDGGFDNGTLVNNTNYIFDDLELGKIYSFKVKAVNKGGISFDSETLSASISNFNHNPVLIINAFEKLSAPEYFETDSLGGFPGWKKGPIADGIEYSFTGNQYNFDKNDPWKTNPLTGHGASYSNYEGLKVSGNTFDYPLVHGKQFARHNISFVSTSIKAFEIETESFISYNKIDIIYGKQSVYSLEVNKKQYDYSVFRKETRDALSIWMKENSGSKTILLSGAFIASDVFLDNRNDTLRTAWVKNNFNYNIVTNYASVDGEIVGGSRYVINKKPNEINYELRSIDALKTINNGEVIYRYKENNYPSAIYSEINSNKILVLGFPIESVVEDKNNFFDEIIEKLEW